MLFDKMNEAFATKDKQKMRALYHPDYTFVRHQNNVTMTLADWLPVMDAMMDSDSWEIHNSRCLYENDDVLVMHNVLSFPDGTKEAVLGFHTKKDGLILCTETGATPIT